MVEQTSIFSVPEGLGKAQTTPGVPPNLSGPQYICDSESQHAATQFSHRLGVPFDASLLFCLSLQLGLSPPQDLMYSLIYALAMDSLGLIERPGAKNALFIITAAAGLSAISSLLLRSLLSFYFHRHPAAKPALGRPKPMFFPVQTSHTRLFPKVHSLSYPFMWTGIPVGFRGNIGGILSCDCEIKKSLPAWFTVDARDYMGRGNDNSGLDGKLQQFLVAQGADPRAHPYAYLLTVANFYGHAFNPVSFYFLYSATRSLSAVILEVNNTFGERHLYFLNSSTTPSSVEPNAPTRFTSSFRKDFFVSPFSDRSGSYSLVTNDPLYPNMTGVGPIKLCLTLSSDAGKPKVVARVYSNGVAIDPAALSWWQGQRFAMVKAWDTWATEPRTVYQAVLLMFKRGLSIFTVPEPLKTSISRRAKGHEVVIEGVFRQFLQEVVMHGKPRLSVQYFPAGISGSTAESIESPAAEDDASEDVSFVTFRVLTPLFYARVVRYKDVIEALREEASQGQTVEVGGLHHLVEAASHERQNAQTRGGLIDIMMLRSLPFLRRAPQSLVSNVVATDDASIKPGPVVTSEDKEIDSASSSGMGNLESFCHNKEEERLFLMAVLKLLLSDWIAMNSLDLLAVQRSIVRVGLIWIVGNGLRKVLQGVLS